MNKRFYTLLTVVVLLLALAGGCVRAPRMDILRYDLEQETASDAGCPLTHKLDISVEYPVIKGDAELSSVLMRQAIFEAAFGDSYDTLNVEDAAGRYAADLAAEFKELSAAMWRGWRKAGIDTPEITEWSDNIEGYFAGQKGPYRSYIVNITDFTGGAHSSSVTHAFVFDTRDGSRLTLDDLFVQDFDGLLTDIINRHIPEYLDEEDIDSLFESPVPPTGNYILTSDSITFIYNPYEIGPYSLGTPSISVPLRELKKAGLLSRELRTR